jgi:hypothetical protein
MTFRIVYKTIATQFNDTNDAQLNNTHNVQLIKKGCFTRSGLSGYILCSGSLVATRSVGSWLCSVFVAERCGTTDLVTWGADGWTFKQDFLVVRIGSSFPQCPDVVTNTAHNQHSS